jgi:hypothetical protein
MSKAKSSKAKGVVSPQAASPEAQMAALSGAPVATLRDVVVDEMLQNRQPERPIASRMVLAGEIVSKDDPPKQFFEDAIAAATSAVNAADPLGGRISSHSAETITVSGCFVEMQSHFYLLLESEPAHLLAVAQELHERLNVKKSFDGLKAVHVLQYADDVVSRAFPKWCALEAQLPPLGAAAAAKPLEEQIVDAGMGVMALGKQLATLGRIQTENFLAGAKNTHAQLLPRASLVEACIASGLCLTLTEYTHVYADVPLIVRPAEVSHPSEPPLNY